MMDDINRIQDNYSDLLNFTNWCHEVYGTPKSSEIEHLLTNLTLLKSCYDEYTVWSDRFDTLQQVSCDENDVVLNVVKCSIPFNPARLIP